MSQHAKNLERKAAERRERREREEREAAAAQEAANGAGAEPPGQEVATNGKEEAALVPAQQAGPASRPQPLTPDLIPEPQVVNATGELSADEQNDLAQCERAFHHAAQAAWMKGKAAHAVRDRRLYREGGRTWPQYCEEEIGESESDVNRQIQEWPLAAAVSAIYPAKKAVPASHVRALLPLTKLADIEHLATSYTNLRVYAAEHGLKVTAAALTSMVERFSKAADPLPIAQFGAAIRAIAPSVPDQKTVAQKSTAAENHPNLGDAQAPVAGEAAPTATPDAPPPANHPNLGDSSEAASGAPQSDRDSAPALQPDGDVGAPELEEVETVDVEIIDESRAVALLATLTQSTSTLRDDLRDTTPATLKAISEAARNIADVAESFL